MIQGIKKKLDRYEEYKKKEKPLDLYLEINFIRI